MIQLLAALFLALAGLPALAGDPLKERVVRVLNWSDYIDPRVLEAFTRETGVKIVYDTYDSIDMLEKPPLSGGLGYDVVVLTAPLLERQIMSGALQPIDRARLANADNIATEIDGRLSSYDPGSRHAIPYMWGATGVAYNVAKVRERIGRPIIGWEQVLRPEALKKLSDCGVYMPDSPDDLLPTVLNFLRMDPNTKSAEDLRKAADHLASLRKYVKKFQSAENADALVNAEACLVIGRTTDAVGARSRAREVGVDIAYVVPAEGASMSFDALAIPRDAAHLNPAYLFMDYLLRPDIAARNSHVTNTANGIDRASIAFDKYLVDDPALYPGEATMRRLFTVRGVSAEQSRMIGRLWATVKASR